MHLWQLDLVGGIFLADGRECKMVTGINDHSRFAVIATVLAVSSGRAVADAFVRAVRVGRCDPASCMPSGIAMPRTAASTGAAPNPPAPPAHRPTPPTRPTATPSAPRTHHDI